MTGVREVYLRLKSLKHFLNIFENAGIQSPGLKENFEWIVSLELISGFIHLAIKTFTINAAGEIFLKKH